MKKYQQNEKKSDILAIIWKKNEEIDQKCDLKVKFKCGENRNHGKFKIYFLMVEL